MNANLKQNGQEILLEEYGTKVSKNWWWSVKWTGMAQQTLIPIWNKVRGSFDMTGLAERNQDGRRAEREAWENYIFLGFWPGLRDCTILTTCDCNEFVVLFFAWIFSQVLTQTEAFDCQSASIEKIILPIASQICKEFDLALLLIMLWHGQTYFWQ